MKAQGARAKHTSAAAKLEAVRQLQEKARAKMVNARDAWFEVWLNSIARGVEARNKEVALMTGDEHIQLPAADIDAARLQGKTLDLVRAVALVRALC